MNRKRGARRSVGANTSGGTVGASRTANRQITWQRWLGLLASAAGFAVIGLGWAGAARRTCVDCQIPYLLSGGAAGLGLVVFGVGMLVMAQVRTEGRRLASRVERIGVVPGRAPGTSEAVPDTSLVPAGPSTHPDSALAGGPEAATPVEAEPSAVASRSARTEVLPVVHPTVRDEDLSAAEREAFGEDALQAPARRSPMGTAANGNDGAVKTEPERGLWRRRRTKRSRPAGEA